MLKTNNMKQANTPADGAERTKGNWLLQEPTTFSNRRRVYISDKDGDLKTILVLEDYTENEGQAKANAKYIVKTVNNHERLLEALKLMVEHFGVQADVRNENEQEEAKNKAYAAIAEAEKED